MLLIRVASCFAKGVPVLARGRLALITLSVCTSVVCTSWSSAHAQTDPNAAPTSRAAELTAPPPPVSVPVATEPAPVVPPPALPSTPVAPTPPAAAPVSPARAAPLPAAAPVRTASAPERGPSSVAVDTNLPPPKRREPMNAFAFGLKVGFAQVGAGDVANPTYVAQVAALPPEQLARYGLDGSGCDIIDKRCRTRSRAGFHLAIPLQIGGSGVGFRVEPFLTLADNAKAYGVYAGPTFEFRVAPPLYLGFGLGVKAAYVKLDPWKYAGDVYGRIPLSATWYVVDDFALVFELGFGAGASAYYRERLGIMIPATSTTLARTVNKKDVAFGFARTWDLSVGVRFP
jgi:hypothetical protein